MIVIGVVTIGGQVEEGGVMESEASKASRQTLEVLYLAVAKRLEEVGLFRKQLRGIDDVAKGQVLRPVVEVVVIPLMRVMIDLARQSNGAKVVTKADLNDRLDLRPIAQANRLTMRQARFVLDAVLHQVFDAGIFAGKGLPVYRDKKSYLIRGSGRGLTISAI